MSANDRVTRSLPHLQNLIKRDPEAYREDFKLQYLHFESQFTELTAKPDAWNKSLAENISFVSQVAHCYPEECKGLSQMFMDVLRLYSTVLNNDIRLVIVRALILMRNRGLIDCVQLCELFFLRLLQCQDRLLRVTIQTHIINDVKKQNDKHKNHKLNSTLQNFMCTIIKESNATAVKMALDIMVDLYRKNIWNDTKTVNIIASTCFSKITKVQVAALNFFLCNNQAKDDDKDSDSDDDKVTKKDILLGHRVGKKSAKRKKKTERALKALEKQKKKKKVEIFDFSALHLLYDPQDFVERLFRQLESSNERFEVKLLHQDLISRLIGIHQLLLLNFYPYLQRYLQPHQRQVTKILLYVAQASHEFVPPDILQSICKTIANNFITERNSGEVMAVGLNTIRELCSKCYLAMDEDLLHDLSKYKSYRDKSVAASARSLIQVFREKNPQLLERKDRGKPTEFQRDLVPLAYGQVNTKSYLEGAETLLDNTDEQDKQSSDDEEQSDEEGWVNVSHSSDDENEEAEEEEEEEEEEDDDDDNEKEGDENKMEVPLTEEERRERAISVSTQRILTQREFEQLKLLEMKKRIQDRRRNRLEQALPSSKKRKTISIDTDSDSDDENKKGKLDQNSNLISLKDIERVHKKRAHDKESRLETVLAGREGRAKFGKWKKEKGRAGTTNKEKLKNKNFQMLKPKLRKKQKRSFRDKQIALRDALLKDKRLR